MITANSSTPRADYSWRNATENPMADIEWALTEDAPVKEKFGGTIKVRTLWQAPSGATAQVVEIIRALVGRESIFMSLGPKRSM